MGHPTHSVMTTPILMEATIMWIITKLSGVISSEAVTRFTENSFGTYAQCHGGSYLVSQIITALKSGDDFLEVE